MAMDRVAAPQAGNRTRDCPVSQRDGEQILAAHRAVFEAVQARDIQLAQKRLLEDMQDSGRNVERWFAARGRQLIVRVGWWNLNLMCGQ